MPYQGIPASHGVGAVFLERRVEGPSGLSLWLWEQTEQSKIGVADDAVALDCGRMAWLSRVSEMSTKKAARYEAVCVYVPQAGQINRRCGSSSGSSCCPTRCG